MINGTGVAFYGMKNRKIFQSVEVYDTTRWIVIVWLPILPLGSFKIQRATRQDFISRIARNLQWSEPIHILEKRDLDWVQIFKVYLFSFLAIALLTAVLGVFSILIGP
ncbi:MAG: hypothetical protein P5702_24640 [Limnospira sp. PMC 1291.21]|uniref:hypothetical protein n=1 Tax=unclassified Limnospira TaxID=2642885 RepID=UPI0028E10D7F|nr:MULTISPECIES: hypothetical protein [unclassified Limnospira]MDT9298099.1 hypothetical protein [Arthrospira platensis PCC 7345]MDT9180753.1 hypothetical protein [Limnospira sp. PMC 1238.20]MDT9190951.1 hypothetical protein [Limnospira sp. PMC 894.15]MDT9196062.1 hypothetical protein [Limnospira sp. PMC 1245.20]MDT9201190.1 hypothetical protein [Limnospira sp. PMC 1042.18]